MTLATASQLEILPTGDQPVSGVRVPRNTELISLIQFVTWLTRASVLYRMTRKPLAWREMKIHQKAAQFGASIAFAAWWCAKMSDRALIWKLLGRSLRFQRWQMVVEILNEWAKGDTVKRREVSPPEAPSQHESDVTDITNRAPLATRNPPESVVVVVHETSRTGAPILAWNLVDGLRKQYDVVTIRLGDGPLTPEFEAISSEVIDWRDRHSKSHRLLAKRRFRYAIVNSCESRELIEVCRKYSIPTVFLMHEFASYVYAIDSLRAAFDAATEIVFSSPIIARDARRVHPVLSDRELHILPQGRCLIPSSYSKQPSMPPVIENLRRAKAVSNAFIVVGAGTVQFRKGVDLFLQTAAAVEQELPSRDVQFVWIGRGYNPDGDKEYSIYLKEQVQRSKLRLAPIFVDELGDLSAVYSIADVLMLSSRLDPLPNVSIDAATEGVPIVCFDDASGMADILLKNPVTSTAVAAYCDTSAAARVIAGLVTNRSNQKLMSDSIRCLAAATFDMKSYVARLNEIGTRASQKGG